jgi:hypothetical protein
VDSAKLNNWMQIVGMFAIVASMIFVGLQMKQSQEIDIAAQYHERAALAIDNFNAELESWRLLLADSGSQHLRFMAKIMSASPPIADVELE